MVSDKHRRRAAETLTARWQDPEFRAKMQRLGKAQDHPTGERHGNWKGGETRTNAGYVRVWNGTKYIPRSHAVWNAAHPNDPILPGEHIHHSNRIRDDDRPENLQKIAAGDHNSLHHKGRVWTPEHRAKAVAGMRKAQRQYTVKSCGNAHSGCRLCTPSRWPTKAP